MNDTAFACRPFIDAWIRGSGNGLGVLPIPVQGSGSPRSMYGVVSYGRARSRRIVLGPSGLYASPGWDGSLEPSTVKGILKQLKGIRTHRFDWSVRFDHVQLADRLTSSGVPSSRTTTHVLRLSDDYEKVFSNYSATVRNQVRRARREGVTVREALSEKDVLDYYRVVQKLSEQKTDYRIQYSANLFEYLVNLRDVSRLLIAECSGNVVAGGLFFRDGCSVLYWHGASDRAYSRLYPTCAVLDEAIRWACGGRASFFNFGGSGGSTSLAQFKAFWGASLESNWRFTWENPLWRRLHLAKKMTRSFLGN